MSDASRGIRCFTFYSYKGGVGRSMALANVAIDLASRNDRKVLLIDWDLEAPGLHYYFGYDDSNLYDQPGLVDYFVDAARALEEKRSSDGLSKYVLPVVEIEGRRGQIGLMTCGKMDSEYGTRVELFDWVRFYEKQGGFAIVESLRRSALSNYDIVLVDARSGHSNTAILATLQMPELLVMLFTANEQSLSGTVDVARQLRHNRSRADWGRPPLRFIFGPSRVFTTSSRFNEWLSGPASRVANDLEAKGLLERSLQPRGLSEFLFNIEPDASVGETLLQRLPNGETLALHVVYRKLSELFIQLERGDIDWRMDPFVPYALISKDIDGLRDELHQTVRRGDEHNANLLRLSLSKLLLRTDHAGYYTQVSAMLPGAYSYFKMRKDERSIAITCLLLGRAELRSGNYELALEYLYEAQAIVKALGDRLGEAVILHDLGNVEKERCDQLDLANYNTALQIYDQSLKVKEDLGEYAGLALTYHQIGAVWFNLKVFDKAEAAYKSSLTAAERAHDIRSQAIAYHSLGNLFGQQKINDKAIEFFQKALELQDLKSNPQGQAITHRRIGDSWRHSVTKDSTKEQKRSNLIKALSSYQHSLDLATQIEDLHNMQMLHARIGETHKALNDPALARLSYQEALGLGRVEQHPGGLAEVYFRLAELEFETGRDREGRGLLQATERELKATQDVRIRRRVNEKIADLKAKHKIA